jgi:hypothetical protein
MIKERVICWSGKNNRSLPEEILLYRSGVSDGQFGMLKLEEVAQVTEGFKNAVQYLKNQKRMPSGPYRKPAPELKVTFVAITKDCHVRFFKPDAELLDSENNNNPSPGLVVDSTVVEPHSFNFYLQSHATSNGTSKSAHYTVIFNGMEFSSGELQSVVITMRFEPRKSNVLTSRRPTSCATPAPKLFIAKLTKPSLMCLKKSRMACPSAHQFDLQNTCVRDYVATFAHASRRSLLRNVPRVRIHMMTPSDVLVPCGISMPKTRRSPLLGTRVWMIRNFSTDLRRLKMSKR